MTTESDSSALASTSAIDVRESPSPQSTERCDLCDLSFDNHVLKKVHNVSIIHHVRLETKFKPCWHRCAPCKFSCDVLADYSKHIDTEDHKMKLEAARRKWIAMDRKFKMKQPKGLVQSGVRPLTNFGGVPMPQPSPLWLSAKSVGRPSSHLYFPPGVPRFDAMRPPPLFFPTETPSPSMSFFNYNFPRNTPRTAVSQSTLNQGRTSHLIMPSPPSTSESSTPGTTGCIIKSRGKKQKLKITSDNRRSTLWADVVRGRKQNTAANCSSSSHSEKASKSQAVLIQAKRRPRATNNDTVSTKRRKIVAEADSTTPVRILHPPIAAIMRNAESSAAKQSRWEKIALKSQALFQKTKSARMLKERLQKYRLVKPNAEAVSSTQSQSGAYRHFDSPNAPTVTTSEASCGDAHVAILEETLGEFDCSPFNSTARFEREWQQVVHEVDEAVNSMEDLSFMSPKPSTLQLADLPVLSVSNQDPPNPSVPVQSARVDIESHGPQVVLADLPTSKRADVVKKEVVHVKEEPTDDELEVIIPKQRARIDSNSNSQRQSHQSTSVFTSPPSQPVNTNRTCGPSACLTGGHVGLETAAETWTSQPAPSSSAPALPNFTVSSSKPRNLEVLWLLCQEEQQKSGALEEVNERIMQLQDQLNHAMGQKAQLESELHAISSQKRDLLLLGTGSTFGGDS
uniref:C2H2-type domain-containing protein n=1 Tax=Plectus sambesii TaxID=2011161 RepID=A0A914W541_9BILA